ncbi:hypothetical protein [Neptunomonas japonica]|uniref:Acetyltransferase n=1 Tax=Neptunomonas japonica JAMM 1380 TaxID=1441457 RepID=A0A7R6PRA7_9GAMM|nr:hypothetical protein [Neptunomonas japonica]BBB31182.1 acetyltransferase [Neptunomonas japonica JAMM 1380]
MENLSYVPFSSINLDDSFFSTLKSDYSEFTAWFDKKARVGEHAYVLRTDTGAIEGFMYLKPELGEVLDIDPALPNGKHLKVGTFKFDSHGTRRGERFIKKVFDHAMSEEVDDVYVTVFDKHEYLLHLFALYGFEKVSVKTTQNGQESVLVKNMTSYKGDILKDYPRMNSEGVNKYLLSIQPEYHTRMLPDSILNNESHDLIKDISHSNSIHKIYICAMNDTALFKSGDLLAIYRTNDYKGPARFRSVITSIGVVEQYKSIFEFSSLQDFKDYCSSYSVFSDQELTDIFNNKKYIHIIKFTYNTAMQKRTIRDKLIKEVGLKEKDYWGVMKLTDNQFKHIISLGDINESFIIN